MANGHGGRREGAGRKAGVANTKTREIADKAAAEGLLPLEYMLQTLRDETQTHDERMKAALGAAPYIHPRLTAIQGGDPERPVRHAVEEHIVDHRRRDPED